MIKSEDRRWLRRVVPGGGVAYLRAENERPRNMSYRTYYFTIHQVT